MGSSPTRGSSFFLGKVTALGVLCCFALFVCLTLGVLCCFALFVCLTLLGSFFLPSHLSFKNMYICVQCICMCTCMYGIVQLHLHVYVYVYSSVCIYSLQLHLLLPHQLMCSVPLTASLSSGGQWTASTAMET